MRLTSYRTFTSGSTLGKEVERAICYSAEVPVRLIFQLPKFGIIIVQTTAPTRQSPADAAMTLANQEHAPGAYHFTDAEFS
jgi:hypothetical protein